MKALKPCRVCKNNDYEISPSRIKINDYICKPCSNEQTKIRRANMSDSQRIAVKTSQLKWRTRNKKTPKLYNRDCKKCNSHFVSTIHNKVYCSNACSDKNEINKCKAYGCSRCGWKEGTCDIHHINGRKVDNFDELWNLSYLCPNCHRIAHNDGFDPISIEDQVLEISLLRPNLN